MHKKYFIVILLSHLFIPVSLLFPVLQVPSNAVSELSEFEFFNVVRFIQLNQYTYVTILLVLFTIVELFGVINAIYGLAKNELKHRTVQLSFLMSFSSAILGAMFISASSYIFFVICALSFVLIAYSSIKLMKLEQ